MNTTTAPTFRTLLAQSYARRGIPMPPPIVEIPAAHVKPADRADGTCSACLGGNLCRYCQEQGAKRDRALSIMLRQTVAGIRANEIARVCSRFELESDEGGTREAKAAAYLKL